MNSGMLVIAVLASVIAGAGGGYLAATYGTPDKGSNAAARQAPPPTFDTDPVESKDHSDDIVGLRRDLQSMQSRMGNMVDAKEYEELVSKYNALDKRLGELKTTPTPTGNDELVEGGEDVPPTNRSAIEDVIDSVLEERKAKEEAERQAERERMMEDWNKRRNDAIIERLATDLSLTEVQKVNIGVTLESYAAQRREVWERRATARENDQEFDFQGEMAVVHTNAADAVRRELSSAQVSTFNELLGERNLDSLGGGRRGGFNRGGGRGN